MAEAPGNIKDTHPSSPAPEPKAGGGHADPIVKTEGVNDFVDGRKPQAPQPQPAPQAPARPADDDTKPPGGEIIQPTERVHEQGQDPTAEGWTLERLQQIAAGVNHLWAFLIKGIGCLVIIGAGVLLLLICFLPASNKVQIEWSFVPTALSERGYTPRVLTARVFDYVREIQAFAMRDAKARSMGVSVLSGDDKTHDRAVNTQLSYGLEHFSDEPLDIEVPETGLSLRSLVQFLQFYLGTGPAYFSGEIIQEAGGGFRMTLRRSGQDRFDVSVPDGQIEGQLREAAQYILHHRNPYPLAIWRSKEDPSRCKHLLDQLEQGDDKLHWIPNLRGILAMEEDQYEQAIVFFEQSTQRNAELPVAYLNWGTALLRLGRYEAAIEKFQKAIGVDLKPAKAYHNWGFALMKQKRHREAIEKFKKAIEIDPGYARPHYNWGIVLRKQGQHRWAIEKFKKAIAIDPGYASAYYNWGNALGRLEQYPEAIEKFKKVTEIDPRYAKAYYNWGNALGKLEQYSEAIEKFKTATEIDPDYAKAYYNWGNALRNIERYHEAIQKFKKTIEVDPKNAQAHDYWGDALGKLERYEQQTQQYHQAIKVNPGYAIAHYSWENALEKMEQDQAAAARFKKALEINQKLALAYCNWGHALGEIGEDEEAIKRFKKAIELDPNHGMAYANWGYALRRLERLEEAIETYQATLKINPQDAMAHNNWGLILEQLGQTQEAIKKYRQAIALDPLGHGGMVARNNLQAMGMGP